MTDYFEYWTLPEGTDNETTRIVNITKDGKYLLFHRDDEKVCKYDLSSGEIIGFRGKPVKSLSSQLKDLTVNKMIEITSDDIYKKFLNYVYSRRPKHRAWLFVSEALPKFMDYEQYFTSGFTNFSRLFHHGYSEVSKGLIKFCKLLDLTLNDELYDDYNENPNVYNMLLNMDLENYTKLEMIKAISFGDAKSNYHGVVNPTNLTNRVNNKMPIRKINIRANKSYFNRLVDDYGYNSKKLILYIDRLNLTQKRRTVCRDLFDYVDMMNQLYDDFDKYPRKLSAAHKQAIKEYNRFQVDYDENAYSQRNVLEYECEIDGFRFIYPRKASEIQAEGRNQHNCVATYISRVLSEDCHIMFMRPITDINTSYITLEIRNNKIVQAKRKYNREPSKKELGVIDKWNKKYCKFELN